MKYILDVDRTLFDATAWRVDNGGSYTPEIVQPQTWTDSSAVPYLYDDVLPWLASKPRDSLHILTAMSPALGDAAASFQVAKLAHSSIADYVSGLTFMVGDKGPYVAALAGNEPLCFVDDSLAHHVSVKKHVPQVTCCVMMRAGTPVPEIVPDDIHIVHSLADVDAIVSAL